MGFQIDFITPDQKENFCKYKIISAPFLLTCDETLLDALEVYVQQGGVFYGEPRISFLDEKGWYQLSRPAKQLQRIFGLRQTAIQCVSQEDTRCENGMSGHWHKEEIEDVGGKAIIKYQDQTPALLCHSYGKGSALYATSYFALGAMLQQETIFLNVMQTYLKSQKIHPYVSYSECLRKHLDVQLLEDDHRIVLCLEQTPCTSQERKSVILTIQVEHNIQSALELMHHQELSFQQYHKEVKLSISMPPQASLLIELTYES